MSRAASCPRDCPGRRVGCHSRCREYRERREKNLRRYEQQKLSRMIDEVRYSGAPKK